MIKISYEHHFYESVDNRSVPILANISKIGRKSNSGHKGLRWYSVFAFLAVTRMSSCLYLEKLVHSTILAQ